MLRADVFSALCEWFLTFHQITNLAALTERQSRTSRSMIVQLVSRSFRLHTNMNARRRPRERTRHERDGAPLVPKDARRRPRDARANARPFPAHVTATPAPPRHHHVTTTSPSPASPGADPLLACSPNRQQFLCHIDDSRSLGLDEVARRHVWKVNRLENRERCNVLVVLTEESLVHALRSIAQGLLFTLLECTAPLGDDALDEHTQHQICWHVGLVLRRPFAWRGWGAVVAAAR